MYVLKQWVLMVGLLALGLFSQVFALSFAPWTIFLDASSEADCVGQWGSYMERYDEVYCTTTAEEFLEEDKKQSIMLWGDKLLELLASDQEAYDELLETLWDFSSIFSSEWDYLRQAVAQYLIEYLEEKRNTIPESCTVWYDGCNICQVGDEGLLACTRMACAEYETPECRVYEKIIDVAPETVECVGVWPQTCLQISEVGQGDWMNFYGSVEWFEYIEGYTRTLLVEEVHLDPKDFPADGSSIEWSLVEVIAIDAEIPEGCQSWYDGCNTCIVTNWDMMACTEMACLGEPLMPYCKDEWSDNTKATDYNSSRSNKSL